MFDEIKNTDIPVGVILKSATVDASDVTAEDLRKINKFTLTPLKAEDVFVFKATLGDNEIASDRNFEPFNLDALKDMKRLYIGKTVIKDHRRSADNQIARVYDTELISEAKTTDAGEAYAKLVAKCYMIRTESNKDLIAEINGGIKREVSTSCIPKKAICSICGVDNMKTYCPHYPSREYDGKTCFFTLDGAKDVHELSFVAVPAQIGAGTSKNYSGVKPEKDPEIEKTEDQNETVDPIEPIEETKNTENDDLEVRIRMSSAFITINE